MLNLYSFSLEYFPFAERFPCNSATSSRKSEVILGADIGEGVDYGLSVGSKLSRVEEVFAIMFRDKLSLSYLGITRQQ